MYILNEVSFSQCIERLEIKIKEKQISADNNNHELNFKLEAKKETNYISDLDSIGLESIKSKKSPLVNSKNEDNNYNNFNNIISMLNKNSINYLESENYFINDSNPGFCTNKDFKKKTIFSNSINNSNINTENENLKHCLNFNSLNNKSFKLSSSKLNKSVEMNLNSSNNNIKKSQSPDQIEILDCNNKNLKGNSSNKNIGNNNDHVIQNQNMTINFIQGDRNHFNINIINPDNEIQIEKNSKCIDQSCLSFFCNKKDDNKNNKSCVIF